MGEVSFVRDWFAKRAKPEPSTFEKLGNRESHRIEAEDDGFEESKHPRDHGKFTAGSGAGGESKKEVQHSTPLKKKTLKMGKTKAGEKLALVLGSSPRVNPDKTIHYVPSYGVYVLKSNYSGKHHGGMVDTWRVAQSDLTKEDAEKLFNKRNADTKAQDDTAASGNFGGKADWKLAAKAVKKAPKDPSVINQAFAKGGLKSGAMKSPGEAYVRSQMMPKANDGRMVLLALDHGLLHCYNGGIRTRPDRDGLAFDIKSVRSFTDDGYLHVEVSNISKATVNPYLGREIPDWDQLGLDPNRIYNLFRDPEELARAAPTFNNLPLLKEHVPVSSESFPEGSIIGSTGTDAEFDKQYLKNSLVFWKKRGGIDDLESNRKRELSSAYRYTFDPTPGSFQGQRYDGVMRNIIGNHVALVEEGRAGPDVMVGDSMENIRMSKKKPQMSARAAIAILAVSSNLRPKLAADSKLNLRPLFDGVTAKNFAQRKPEILKGLRASLKLRTILAADRKPVSKQKAMDATIGEVAELLDMIENHGVENDVMASPGQMAAVEPAAEVAAPAAAPPPAAAGGDPAAVAAPGAEEPGLAGAEEGEGEEEEGGEEMGAREQLASLLKGKVDEATLAKAMECVGGGAQDAEGGEGKLKELGAADDLLVEDPNAEKGTGTGAGSPGGGPGSAEDEDMEDEAEDAVVLAHEHESGKGGPAKDQPPPFKGMPKPGGKMVGDRKLTQADLAVYNKRNKIATDAAIKDAVAAERENSKNIREAENFIRPWVGSLPEMSFDSASEVYHAALIALGMDEKKLDDIHPSAYRALVESRPKPGERSSAPRSRNASLASDSKIGSAKTYAERFPNAARIRHM